LKILFYNHTGQVGGAERLLLAILARLDRTAFDATVICPDSGGLRKMVAELGVRNEALVDLKARFTWRVDLLVQYLKSFIHVIVELRKKIIRVNPDLIHANSVRAGLVATFATLGLGKPVVWHIHDLLPRHPFNPLIRAVGFFAPRTRMIAVAQASADRFIGSFRGLRERVTVIRNGIDRRIFHPDQTAKQKICSELDLLANGPVIGIVGRLTPSKGQLELLRAFPFVLREFPTATLLIAGAPAFNQEHEYLQILTRTASELGISNRVRMLGSRDDVAAIMQALDLLVINSSVEACCLVALEAMACGTPVLATNTGGTPEIIEHGTSGWLIPLRDESALAAAIVKLIGQPAVRARLAEHGTQRVASTFSIGRYMTELQSFYLNGGAESVTIVSDVQPAQAKTKFA
jgi:glycosyltransferase involved in cell wall biosynthesis